jgi:NAD(P)H dehydrogenase (quinone)
MTVLVFGATGNVGRHVVEALMAQGTPTRVITRQASKAASTLPAGVDIVEGDLGHGPTVMAALDGVESVFLLTPHGYNMADVQLRIIRELRRTGIKIVKLSGTASAVRPDGPQALRQHWEVETILKASEQPYVVLRPNAFMQTMINQIMLPTIKATGKMPNAISKAGLSMIDAVDIAAVAAQVLTKPDWDGETIVLTGPRAVTYYEIADHIGSVRGQTIEVLEITPEDVRDSSLARGLELWEAEHFQEMYQMFRDRESEYVTDDVERIAGRAPGTIESYLERNAEAFRDVPA